MLLHGLLIDVGNYAECHTRRLELLLDEFQQFVSGYLSDGRFSAKDISAERVTLEEQFFELVVYVF